MTNYRTMEIQVPEPNNFGFPHRAGDVSCRQTCPMYRLNNHRQRCVMNFHAGPYLAQPGPGCPWHDDKEGK